MAVVVVVVVLVLVVVGDGDGCGVAYAVHNREVVQVACIRKGVNHVPSYQQDGHTQTH